MGSLSAEDIAAWVASSRARQGVDLKIRDPRTMQQVRALLTGQAGRTAPARTRGRSAPDARLDAPDGIDSVDVEPLRTRLAGADDGMIEDGSHDRCLSGQVEISPRSA